MSLAPADAQALRTVLATAVAVPVTPLHADGTPDWDTYAKLIGRLVDAVTHSKVWPETARVGQEWCRSGHPLVPAPRFPCPVKPIDVPPRIRTWGGLNRVCGWCFPEPEYHAIETYERHHGVVAPPTTENA